MLALQVLLALAGGVIIALTVLSAVRTLVVPRASRDPLAKWLFTALFQVFMALTTYRPSYERSDRIMVFYAPVGLIALIFMWLFLFGAAYTCLFIASGVDSLHDAIVLSGSSIFTLGFASPGEGLGRVLLSFSAATFGLGFIALLIAYLPAMYSAFQRREAEVAMLEVRAGSPPSPVELLARYQRIRGLDQLGELWERWELWFTDIDESHTSLAALNFFRSPRPQRSWVTAAGVVLDAAALTSSTLDIPHDARADLCLRAGYLALQHIAEFFEIDYNAEPHPQDPISISRAEYDAAYDQLAAAGLPLKSDREACWRSFAGWRVNYDTVLLEVAEMVVAPYVPWVSDRGALRGTNR